MIHTGIVSSRLLWSYGNVPRDTVIKGFGTSKKRLSDASTKKTRLSRKEDLSIMCDNLLFPKVTHLQTKALIVSCVFNVFVHAYLENENTWPE